MQPLFEGSMQSMTSVQQLNRKAMKKQKCSRKSVHYEQLLSWSKEEHRQRSSCDHWPPICNKAFSHELLAVYDPPVCPKGHGSSTSCSQRLPVHGRVVSRKLQAGGGMMLKISLGTLAETERGQLPCLEFLGGPALVWEGPTMTSTILFEVAWVCWSQLVAPSPPPKNESLDFPLMQENANNHSILQALV